MHKKQEITLSIPQPCTQEWDRMTSTEQGKHCTSCNKTVIDFSNYTDEELVEFFQKAKGEVCGRVNNYQVNRELLFIEQRNRSFFHKLIYGTALASWLGIASTANAQSNNTTATQTEQKKTGEIKRTEQNNPNSDSLYVRGLLTDSITFQPLPFANVTLYVNGTQIAGAVTDIDGKFRIGPIEEFHGKKIELKCVNEGYKDYTMTLKPGENFVSVKMGGDSGQLQGLLIIKRDNKPFSTPDGSTFDKDDSPYLAPKPH